VLLDEIEKAHPDVFNILLQILTRRVPHRSGSPQRGSFARTMLACALAKEMCRLGRHLEQALKGPQGGRGVRVALHGRDLLRMHWQAQQPGVQQLLDQQPNGRLDRDQRNLSRSSVRRSARSSRLLVGEPWATNTW
jgi:hypothetical protein